MTTPMTGQQPASLPMRVLMLLICVSHQPHHAWRFGDSQMGAGRTTAFTNHGVTGWGTRTVASRSQDRPSTSDGNSMATRHLTMGRSRSQSFRSSTTLFGPDRGAEESTSNLLVTNDAFPLCMERDPDFEYDYDMLVFVTDLEAYEPANMNKHNDNNGDDDDDGHHVLHQQQPQVEHILQEQSPDTFFVDDTNIDQAASQQQPQELQQPEPEPELMQAEPEPEAVEQTEPPQTQAQIENDNDHVQMEVESNLVEDEAVEPEVAIVAEPEAAVIDEQVDEVQDDVSSESSDTLVAEPEITATAANITAAYEAELRELNAEETVVQDEIGENITATSAESNVVALEDDTADEEVVTEVAEEDDGIDEVDAIDEVEDEIDEDDDEEEDEKMFFEDTLDQIQEMDAMNEPQASPTATTTNQTSTAATATATATAAMSSLSSAVEAMESADVIIIDDYDAKDYGMASAAKKKDVSSKKTKYDEDPGYIDAEIVTTTSTSDESSVQSLLEELMKDPDANTTLASLVNLDDFKFVSPPEDEIPLKEGQRLVCIGDIHGDMDALRESLSIAGVVSKPEPSFISSLLGRISSDDTASGNDLKWSGGNTIVVQCGDVLDRGSEELSSLSLLAKLSREAKEAGGAIIMLYGNHEAMNNVGLFQYTTDDQEYEKIIGKRLDESSLETQRWRVQFGGNQPARWATYEPGGILAEPFLSKMKLAVKVGKTVCVHAGLTTEQLEEHGGIAGMNRQAREWITQTNATFNNFGSYKTLDEVMDKANERYNLTVSQAPSFLMGGIGQRTPVWMRDYSSPPDVPLGDKEAVDLLEDCLDYLDADRMVMGHSVQRRINGVVDGKAWRIDVGMSNGVMGNLPEVLEVKMKNGKEVVSVLTVDGSVSSSERVQSSLGAFLQSLI